ncbi:MAG: hypothetical protein JNK82_39970 [Myxococcaceae bacterium]|nr:hypothetical protein [Myxococcaceae bacterium]
MGSAEVTLGSVSAEVGFTREQTVTPGLPPKLGEQSFSVELEVGDVKWDELRECTQQR